MHLYPFGFELLSSIDINIDYLAKYSRFSLETGNNVLPDIMSDSYLQFRVEEYLVTDLFPNRKKLILMVNLKC